MFNLTQRSQNNRALRSNPNVWVDSNNNKPHCSHKITEPYAQIPTIEKKGEISPVNIKMSQNNRALRSNPNSTRTFTGTALNDHVGLSHKITEPYAQIPTILKKLLLAIRGLVLWWRHKITEPYAQIPTSGFLKCLDYKASQNNRALRSNPNKKNQKNFSLFIERKGHKITEPYAQIPTIYIKDSIFASTHLIRHKITEPYAQIPTWFFKFQNRSNNWRSVTK